MDPHLLVRFKQALVRLHLEFGNGMRIPFGGFLKSTVLGNCMKIGRLQLVFLEFQRLLIVKVLIGRWYFRVLCVVGFGAFGFQCVKFQHFKNTALFFFFFSSALPTDLQLGRELRILVTSLASAGGFAFDMGS